MHAVIRTGGKQYRVAEGDVLRVEKLEAEAGKKIDLDEVLLISDGENVQVGTPLVDGGKVTAEVQAHGRGEKIDVIKFKRRKKYRRQYGHRQDYTELKVTGITGGKGGGKKKAAAKSKDTGAGKKADEAKAGEKKAASKPAAKKTTSKSASDKSAAGKSASSDSASGKSKTGTAGKRAKSADAGENKADKDEGGKS